MGSHDTSKFREAFAPLTWAVPYFDRPDWDLLPRRRTLVANTSGAVSDNYGAETLSGESRIHAWAELYPKIALTHTPVVDRTISLFKFGPGLSGFPNICHGGAIMTMIDEALGAMMLAKMREVEGTDQATFIERWDSMLGSEGGIEAGKLSMYMKDFFVTAKLDLKFLAPVLCPGVVGVECKLVEKTKDRMKIDAVMKDGKGRPLVRAESLWVQMGKAKL